MEAMGIIRRSCSAWALQIHMLPKGAGSSRPCRDYRRLNDLTVTDHHPIPRIHNFSAEVADMIIFSKVHLVRDYHQIDNSVMTSPKQ